MTSSYQKEWFDDEPHPHDSMPIANGSNRYAPPEKMLELEDYPPLDKNGESVYKEESDWFETDTYASRHKSTPDHEKGAEEIVTMHEKMYRIATSRYNPFSVGGSENCHSDVECPPGGGSEEWHDSKPG